MGCFVKLFNSILNTRLNEYLTENDIIDKTQIDFQKNTILRNSDHTSFINQSRYIPNRTNKNY